MRYGGKRNEETIKRGAEEEKKREESYSGEQKDTRPFRLTFDILFFFFWKQS